MKFSSGTLGNAKRALIALSRRNIARSLGLESRARVPRYTSARFSSGGVGKREKKKNEENNVSRCSKARIKSRSRPCLMRQPLASMVVGAGSEDDLVGVTARQLFAAFFLGLSTSVPNASAALSLRGSMSLSFVSARWIT